MNEPAMILVLNQNERAMMLRVLDAALSLMSDDDDRAEYARAVRDRVHAPRYETLSADERQTIIDALHDDIRDDPAEYAALMIPLLDNDEIDLYLSRDDD